jgi:hypothetical protein
MWLNAGHDLLGMGHFFLVLDLPFFLEGVNGLFFVLVLSFVSRMAHGVLAF